MTVSVTGIDHLVIRVRDIDAAQSLFQKLGFFLTDRGFHSGHKSANHTASLADGNYIELVHLNTETTGPGFARKPPSYEGPIAVALQTQDSRKVNEELRALGFDVSPPRDLARPVFLPNGKRDAQFLNTGFPELDPAIYLFTCQHITPDLIWRSEWQHHPNGARFITSVTLVHANPADLRDFYVRLFGEQAVTLEEGNLIIRLPKNQVNVITPQTFQSRFPSISLPTDLSEGWFAGATLVTDSLDNLASLLKRERIAFTQTPTGGLVIDPLHAAGAVLEFTQV